MKKIDTSNERERERNISDRENVNDCVEKEEGERDIWNENF